MNHTGHTVLVLGYGLQGRAAVHDLVRSPGVGKVIVADARPGFEADLPEGGDTAIEAEGIDAPDEEAIRGLV
ncbi:MAG: hypothetical protein K9L28_11210, partial [Synergistales bacterium]|nr:hypothetical protein [Synergistales bacterium]